MAKWLTFYSRGTRTSINDIESISTIVKVDLSTGDIISTRHGKIRCLKPNNDLASLKLPNKSRVNVCLHHLVTLGLDPSCSLFEPVQRFCAYNGHYSRAKKKFIRPKDNCFEVEEVVDENGDTLGGSCKTDRDHMLGGKFHCVWALWQCHHAVNQWYHLFRKRSGSWLHPYADEKYGGHGDGDGGGDYPSFWHNLPPSLRATVYGDEI